MSQPVMLHDVHDDHPPEYGHWLDDCDECWDRLLGHDDDDLKVVVKAYRGRIVLPLSDLREIVKAETVDEFAESIGLGTIREIFIADPDAPLGRARRGA